MPPSPIYRYFKRLSPSEAKCLLCSGCVVFVLGGTGSTSPMWRHLERIHFTEFSKLKRELDAAATSKGPSDSFSSTPEQVAMTEFVQRIIPPAMMQKQTELLLMAMCVAAVSFLFVENVYFEMFIMNFFMTYRLPYRQTMAGSALKTVTVRVNQAFLKKMVGHDVCVTTDERTLQHAHRRGHPDYTTPAAAL